MNNRKIYIPLLIVASLALIFCALSNLYVLVYSDLNALAKVAVGASEISVLAAMYYIIFGSKKETANYYKAFLLLFAIAELIISVQYGYMHLTFLAIFSTIAFSMIVALFFTKDFGKLNSMICSGVVCIVNIVAMLLAIFVKFDETLNIYYILVTITFACLALVLINCVYAKYVDKENRHTK